jgi:hypothetical protein
MRAPTNTSAHDVSGERDTQGGARWVWLGLIGAVVVILAASISWMIRSGSHGIDRNRGPATEAAPGPRGIDAPRTP